MKKKGKISEVIGSPNPSSYKIKGEDGEEVFLHMGDIKANEELLYKEKNISTLKKGDEVEFETSPGGPLRRAIRVKKI